MLALEKLMVFLFVFSILIILKELLVFVLLASSTNSKEEKKITYTTKRLVCLGIAISYVFTIIFTGFKLF